ncbi:MAG: hypothetical protein RL367_1965, partial [Pseudomonadota bacterium]
MMRIKAIWRHILRLTAVLAMALASTQPAMAKPDVCKDLLDQLGYAATDVQNAVDLLKTYNAGNFTYGERKQIQDRIDYSEKQARYIDSQIQEAHCLNRSPVITDEDVANFQATHPDLYRPKPVPITKFPNFDPMKPENQQMMLMCAGTYGFFTSTSAQTNPRDKAAYEAMLGALQKSRGISRTAADDLASEKRWSYGGSTDFSKSDKNRGIEFTLKETALGTFQANMADLADRALLCGNTLGIDKPSLIDNYLSVFYRNDSPQAASPPALRPSSVESGSSYKPTPQPVFDHVAALKDLQESLTTLDSLSNAMVEAYKKGTGTACAAAKSNAISYERVKVKAHQYLEKTTQSEAGKARINMVQIDHNARRA